MNYQDATSIAKAIRQREITAKKVIATTLAKIAEDNPKLNCFTTITAQKAITTAEAIDQQIAQGSDPGPLAGVPFAVKNLFDVAGIPTLAGSKINAENPPATQDATPVAKLKKAGAILVGTLNMDEYAYGFVTENGHYGATHNPHDLTRSAGGSSGGSAAAVAGNLVPISLGSDTNGSIRVPAAFCGIFGFKATYGRLSRAGAFPFVGSLDVIGPFTRSLRDLALVYDLLQGADDRDPLSKKRPVEPCFPTLESGIEGLRIAVADGYFNEGAQPEALEAVAKVAQVLGVKSTVSLPESHRARAAAFIITATEGAKVHLDNLRSRPDDFDPATRDRLLAGALIPASWYLQAQQFRRWYRDQLRDIFTQFDIILAPVTPCVAITLGQETIAIDGQEIPIRPYLGRFTQPISFVGLPVLSFPVLGVADLPLGVQIIAAPYQEALLFRLSFILKNLLLSL